MFVLYYRQLTVCGAGLPGCACLCLLCFACGLGGACHFCLLAVFWVDLSVFACGVLAWV